jgi:signal transduction histidine kinase
MSTAAILKQVPFFSHLDETQLAELTQKGHHLSLPADQIIFQEGDVSDTIYIILSGRVRIYRADNDGNIFDLGTRREGGFFGELALLDSGPRSATAATLTPSEFFILDQRAFHDCVSHYGSEILFRLFTDLSRKVREATQMAFQEEIEQRALRAEAELERHRSLSQMVAGVAHEVNTPLGTISTAVSIVKKEIASPAMTRLAQDPLLSNSLETLQEAVQLMERNIQRASKLIQDFKKVSVSQITDTKENLNISEAVADIIDLFKLSARQAKLTIQILDHLPPGAQARAWVGYRGYLSQIILNLLANIERYAYPGGVGGRVEVHISSDTERQPPVYLLRVTDFGKGIAPDHLPQVFDPFFTTGRAIGGTGLGLAIVRNIVTGALKGTIEITSDLNQGTTVTLTFPQEIPDEPAK